MKTLNDLARKSPDMLRKWCEREDTKLILELVGKEITPILLQKTPGMDLGDMALEAHGVNVGQHSVVNRLKGLGALVVGKEEINYSQLPQVKSMIGSGYTKEDAIRIYKERTTK